MKFLFVPPGISSSLVLIVLTSVLLPASAAGNFYEDTQPTYGGEERVKVLEGGRLLNLNLDHSSGSGFQSKNDFLFGRFDVRLKLVPGNSAGTVTTFYLYSQGEAHDEVDFEFLGNSSGQPYTIHTNVYSQGKGDKEQRFQPWFDPTAAFHNYSIVWNPLRIIFMIDNIPIRVFGNNEAIGVPFPKKQPMKVIASLWNADDWATQGGRVKTDWSNAPFTASYRDFNANGCVWSAQRSASSCSGGTQSTIAAAAATTTGGQGGQPAQDWQTQDLDAKARNRLRWVQSKFMIYNYCSDLARFPQGLPPECKRQTQRF